MAVRTITHESEPDDLVVTVRERIGGDALDYPLLLISLRDHLKSKTGLDDKLTPRLWMRVMFVVNVIQQITHVGGKNRFDIPSPYAADDEIADFYEFLMSQSEGIIKCLQKALELIKAEPAPNPTGSDNETPLANVSEPVSSLDKAS